MESAQSRTRSLPSGTRDILVEEAREMRAVSRALIDAMDASGYGEVHTPALESASGISAAGAYSVIDGGGEPLVLRTDMTIPIARLAINRFSESDYPLRLCYLATSWRRVERHAGQDRELMQAGAELIGGGPGADDEILELSAAVLSAAGLRDWRFVIGHAGVVSAALAGLETGVAAGILDALADRDLVRVDRLAADSGVPLAAEIARTRLPANGFETASAEAAWFDLDGVADLADICATLDPAVRERAVIDLGMHPRLPYYSGFVFEIYDPSLGYPIGGGGSYRPLFEALGSGLTGTGFAVDVRLLHVAIAGGQA